MTTLTSLKYNPANTLERSYMPGYHMFSFPARSYENRASGTWGVAGVTKIDPVKHYLSGADVCAKNHHNYRHYKVPNYNTGIPDQIRRILPIGGNIPTIVGSIEGDDAYFQPNIPGPYIEPSKPGVTPAQDQQNRKTSYMHGPDNDSNREPIINVADINKTNPYPDQTQMMEVDDDQQQEKLSGQQYNSGVMPLTANTNLPIQLGMQVGSPMTGLTYDAELASPQQSLKRQRTDSGIGAGTPAKKSKSVKQRYEKTKKTTKKPRQDTALAPVARNDQSISTKRKDIDPDTVSGSLQISDVTNQPTTKKRKIAEAKQLKRNRSQSVATSVQVGPQIQIEQQKQQQIKSSTPVLLIKAAPAKKKRKNADTKISDAYKKTKTSGEISPTGAQATRSKRKQKK